MVVCLSFVCLLDGCYCINETRTPFVIYDDKVKYVIIDHLSINQLEEKDNDEAFIYKDIVATLKSKFPKDKNLSDYLDGLYKRSRQYYDNHSDYLLQIKKRPRAKRW